MKSIRHITAHTIATPMHGRYLVLPGAASDAPMLLGFPGYGETAEDEFRRLQTIPGIDHWAVVSIQRLHQFYRRSTNEVRCELDDAAKPGTGDRRQYCLCAERREDPLAGLAGHTRAHR